MAQYISGVKEQSSHADYREDVSLNKKKLFKIINNDCLKFKDKIKDYELLILDPPFDQWDKVPKFCNKTILCFTNFQNREKITDIYGTPKIEIIWHFKDGRWVSHNFPRLTHENILIYGKTDNAFVGETNINTPIKKGKGHIGKTKMQERIYYPKEKKQLNSVLEYPRNVQTGVWSKPKALINDLINFINPSSVCDPFMGSGVVAELCAEYNINYLGIEKDKTIFLNTENKLNKIFNQLDFFLEKQYVHE